MNARLTIVIIVGCLVSVSCDRRSVEDRRLLEGLKSGNTNLLSLMLGSGRNINKNIQCDPLQPFKAPPLDIAVQYGKLSIVEWLLRQGANPNGLDDKGDTPLKWAVSVSKQGVSAESREKITELLLKSGADPNAAVGSEYRWTPLMAAAATGESQLTRILLAAGANPNATNTIGQTALHLAANSNVARILIQSGASTSVSAMNGERPRDAAKREQRLEVLSAISERDKADTNEPAPSHQRK